ncbi:hypothetical protein TUM4438_10900 [Shewanella sairae]|uniref:Uncharacterized protein n=1 Tax=Shewanella sairae TaxID=190310 RepID=A0ABQ4P628_9GAMM|nr:hypothetical protein [Shewanella sairae]MCL1130523.1 hypothetical protein [Shewanella sairae]GIU43000.1 hypothetical protein TUM4438_10900 [Shewanella sairae]
MDQPTQNPNVCDKCQPIKNYFLSDTGMCGRCGEVRDCFDAELIAYYQQAGIEDEEFIWLKLPRLRGWNAHAKEGIDAALFSWSEIEREVTSALNES